MKNTSRCVLDFHEIDKTKLAMVGGKGANLGELCRIDSIHVPDGFCVTTEVYEEITTNSVALKALLDELIMLKADNRTAIGEISAKIRSTIEAIIIPQGIENAINRHLQQMGERNAYAVRSSATAEDLPIASFAGQQDTYLNIIGKDAILKHLSKCWASLFTERAVIYRLQNGFDHRKVLLSVVIQKMIFPDAAGIMFTADPVTSNRKTLSIDASFGLGEALVSGVVNADNYKISDDRIADKKVSTKKLAIYASNDGGTREQEVDLERQNKPALTDDQILQLGQIGRTIEAHFGSPQDIEWCLAGDVFYVVQSRPITTLYPIPERPDSDQDTKENYVYVSVGHQQMMTDAMRPLGLSLWQLTAARPMYKAGGRLFVDVTAMLASPGSREILLTMMGQHDPLIKDALTTIIDRGDFIKPAPNDGNGSKVMPPVSDAQTEPNPAIVTELINRSETSLAALKQNIQTKSGTELFDFIQDDIRQLRTNLFDQQHMAALMWGIDAALWINKKMEEWLGEKNAADILSQSVSNNITSQMGLELLDVADAVRAYPEVIGYLQHAKEDAFLDELHKFKGGQATRDAINGYLEKYGMRCAGEIDITNTRWSEKPAILIPLILNNIKSFAGGENARRFEHGLYEAQKKEQDLLFRLKQLPDGEQKATETKQMISQLRNFAGYREYPKYSIVSRNFVYKQALTQEAEKLVQAGIIHQKEDVYYLTFEEFRETVRTNQVDHRLISNRKEEQTYYEKLTPPRVITSDGEIIAGKYNRENIPANAIIGLPVSSGIVEGRARVILKMEDADIGENDILVTTFTDPSWTPLFIAIKGLVTEVGGMMTHGAVIAREYGLPAIVGVENATKLIKDGQHIRVNGIDGYVEIL